MLYTIIKLQNATYFSPNPQSITTYLSEVTQLSSEIVIHKIGMDGSFNGTDLILSVSFGNLSDNRKWRLSFNLEYASFSINSSFTNFSKCIKRQSAIFTAIYKVHLMSLLEVGLSATALLELSVSIVIL